MPRTPEQNEQIRQEKRKLIIETAMRLFADESYAHTSITQIAKAAGIAKGLLYSYFESKEDLLREVVKYGMERSFGAFDMSQPWTKERLLAFVEYGIEVTRREADFMKVYMRLGLQPGIKDVMMQDKQMAYSQQYVMALYAALGENAAEEMMYLTSLVKGFSLVYLFSPNPDSFPFEALKERIVNEYRKKLGLE
jgi:AcrR family transcriptional regulator